MVEGESSIDHATNRPSFTRYLTSLTSSSMSFSLIIFRLLIINKAGSPLWKFQCNLYTGLKMPPASFRFLSRFSHAFFIILKRERGGILSFGRLRYDGNRVSCGGVGLCDAYDGGRDSSRF